MPSEPLGSGSQGAGINDKSDFAYDVCTVRAGDDDSSDEGGDSDADSAFSYDSRTAPTECFALDDDRLLELEDDGDL